jgi:hypothetical protein
LSPSPALVQQQCRLADLVEREVGKADVDFEHRPVPAPFAQPLAEHQRIVTEPQEIVGARIDSDARHQMCFTSSGNVVKGRVAVDLARRRLEQLAGLVRIARDDLRRRHDPQAHPSIRRV